MRIAIIGAGLAGLACAHELERRTLLYSPWNLLASAGKLMDYLPMADDQSTASGPE
jgi:2-polyprenyl-6-methoxyphenol hydroxylase-like FAD-dependent oxidoreductase